MSGVTGKLGMGWLPDLPDFRDYTMEHDEVSPKHRQLGQKESVRSMLKKVGVGKRVKTSLPATADLRAWCSPVEDQGE